MCEQLSLLAAQTAPKYAENYYARGCFVKTESSKVFYAKSEFLCQKLQQLCCFGALLTWAKNSPSAAEIYPTWVAHMGSSSWWGPSVRWPTVWVPQQQTCMEILMLLQNSVSILLFNLCNLVKFNYN